MLKVEFPVNAVVPKAIYDIQYGYTERPNHRNTSWDWAKFEVCMHKYMELGDEDYGVALINDCKYGVGVKDKTIGLTLLRSPKYPDTAADMGEHTFSYAILPHSGNFKEANVMTEAANFNRKVLQIAGDLTKTAYPVSLENLKGCAVIEAIKKAEDSDNIVLRIVEKHGRTASCKLNVNNNLNVYEIDMLEWQDGVKAEENILNFTPFEIKTIILK